ncbi:MAG: ArsR/SmtB family transcription factor [Promethearchaeota archaeon]
MDSVEGMSEFIKAIAHPKRVQILTLLLEKPFDFSNLKLQTNLKKTALANNLTILLEAKLIERFERGTYRITEDGRGLLNAIKEVYDKAKVREDHRRKIKQRRYSQTWLKNIESKTISSPATWESSWISYIGAVLGVLKSYGINENYANVGGYSGYIFALPNVLSRATCPSSPTALGRNVWRTIEKSTELLGYSVCVFNDNGSFPSEEGKLTEEDIKRAKKLYSFTKEAIDSNKPVIIWGLFIPEYGICNGYTNGSYLVSTYRRNTNQPETPISYDALQAPGCLHAILLEEKLPPISEKDDKNAIEHAIKFAEGNIIQFSELNNTYISGADAFDKWADLLENGNDEDLLYHGNSYVGACTLEAEQLASSFLEHISNKYNGAPQSIFLKKSSEEYKNVASLLEKFTEIFPFALDGDMTKAKKLKGSELLRSAINPFTNALDFLKQAQDNWE